MADKNLKIGLQVDPKGFKEAERYLARLRAEGLKVSKALQGQFGGSNLSTGPGRMGFAKSILGDPKALESFGTSAQKVSKILKDDYARSLDALKDKFKQINAEVEKHIKKQEELEKALTRASGAERTALQKKLDRQRTKTNRAIGWQRSVGETLDEAGEGGGGAAGGMFGGGSFWAKAALVTAIAGAITHVLDKNLNSANRWDVHKIDLQAQATSFGNQMAVSGLTNNYHPYLALNQPINEKSKVTVLDAIKTIGESEHAAAIQTAFSSWKSDFLGVNWIKWFQDNFSEADKNIEAFKGRLTQEILKHAQDINVVNATAFDYMSQHALPRVKNARHYAYEGMGDVYKWMPWALGPEGEGVQLMGQYSQAAGAYATSKTATRDMAVRLAKIGVTGGGAQAFAGMLTGTNGDVEQAAKKTEDIFARAFERGLRGRFLDEFAGVVARATLAGGGRTDTTAYGQFLAGMMGKDPDPQKIRSVLGGTAALDAFYAGQSGGSYFQVGGVSAARKALMGANAAGARYGSIDAAILANTELKHLFPGGMSAELKALGFDRPEMRPFLNQYISERFGQLVGAFGTKELRGAWSESNGNFGDFLKNADSKDLTRFGFMLRLGGVVKDQTEYLEMLNAMAAGYGQTGSTALKQLNKDLASSSELAHVTDESSQAARLRKIANEQAKEFDRARETAKNFADDFERIRKELNKIPTTSAAILELADAARAATEALYGVAKKKPPKPKRDPDAPLAPSAQTIEPPPPQKVNFHGVPVSQEDLTKAYAHP
jgi:hypothetical protein